MRNELQKLVDRELSGLCWNECMRQNVLHAISKEEKPVKRKMRFALAMIMILVLAGSLALAAGLMFSPRYDAIKMADKALLNTYGVTDEMLPFFRRTLSENEESNRIFYRGLPFFEGVLGDYTVTILNGKADVAWSLENVNGAWDAKRMQEILELCKENDGFSAAVEMAKADSIALGLSRPQNESDQIPSDEEWVLIEKQQAADAKEAQKLAAYTEAELDIIARSAIRERFGLSEQQTDMLDYCAESCWWYMDDAQAYYSLYYGLNQNTEWTTGDGIYIVDVNVQTGAVEEITYDTGLLGNG